MNKNDIKLVIILLIIIIIFFVIKSFDNNDNNVANVYFENEIIKTIDLSIDKEYVVKGYNGDVVLEVLDNKIRVKEENSLRHLCSKQGYGDVIICLPNKIIIKVEKELELDGVVR